MKKFIAYTIQVFIGVFVVALIISLSTTDPDKTSAQASSEQSAIEPSAPPEVPSSLTLKAYAERSQDDRAAIVKAGLEDLPAPAQDRLQEFIDCMGYMAYEKAPDLAFRKVLGWCETDRLKEPDTFASHFNELAADDLSTEAVSVCNELIKRRLIAPASAEFPWFDHRVWYLGEHEYVVKSYVDAQNVYGTKLRQRFRCELRYTGEGEELLPASWEVTGASFQP